MEKLKKISEALQLLGLVSQRTANDYAVERRIHRRPDQQKYAK